MFIRSEQWCLWENSFLCHLKPKIYGHNSVNVTNNLFSRNDIEKLIYHGSICSERSQGSLDLRTSVTSLQPATWRVWRSSRWRRSWSTSGCKIRALARYVAKINNLCKLNMASAVSSPPPTSSPVFFTQPLAPPNPSLPKSGIVDEDGLAASCHEAPAVLRGVWLVEWWCHRARACARSTRWTTDYMLAQHVKQTRSRAVLASPIYLPSPLAHFEVTGPPRLQRTRAKIRMLK